MKDFQNVESLAPFFRAFVAMLGVLLLYAQSSCGQEEREMWSSEMHGEKEWQGNRYFIGGVTILRTLEARLSTVRRSFFVVVINVVLRSTSLPLKHYAAMHDLALLSLLPLPSEC